VDGLTLLRRATAAGLAVSAVGDRLVVTGPRSADKVARQLIEHKRVVMAVVQAVNDPLVRSVLARFPGAEVIGVRHHERATVQVRAKAVAALAVAGIGPAGA
jgi:hypothetical protein